MKSDFPCLRWEKLVVKEGELLFTKGAKEGETAKQTLVTLQRKEKPLLDKLTGKEGRSSHEQIEQGQKYEEKFSDTKEESM